MRFDELTKDYRPEELLKKDLLADPSQQLEDWLLEAIKTGIEEPNAMTLATANPSGKPSCRTMLLKEIDEKRLIFFTNYGSRKSRELLEGWSPSTGQP